MSTKILLRCTHSPKIIKMRGMLQKIYCEILVCEDCKNDSDLKNFKEIKIE